MEVTPLQAAPGRPAQEAAQEAAEQRLAESVEKNAPEPGVADSAATAAMDANEGETGVEAEQEIAGQ